MFGTNLRAVKALALVLLMVLGGLFVQAPLASKRTLAETWTETPGPGPSGFSLGTTVFSNTSYNGDTKSFGPLTLSKAPTSFWKAYGSRVNSSFGFSVSAAGDVNGDGYEDIIVGAPWDDHTASNAGAAFVYYGSKDGISQTPSWAAYGVAGGVQFGYTVAPAGDVNGDGYSDILVGAPFYANGSVSDAGKVYLYMGSPQGLFSTPGWTFVGSSQDDDLGAGLACAGDVNKDGYADFLVTSVNNGDSSNTSGRALLFFGSLLGPGASPNWTKYGTDGNNMGISVSGAGDVNGDGYSDIILGEFRALVSGTRNGKAQVFFGSPTGPGQTANWSASGSSALGRFGYSVSSAGDVNGDGYSDVLIGAPRTLKGGAYTGAAYVYLGSSSGLSATPSWTTFGDMANSLYGNQVSSVGDVNGDGFGDILVSEPTYFQNVGEVCLFAGSPDGLLQEPTWTQTGLRRDEAFSWAVSSAGDVDRDGRSEFLVGAYNFSAEHLGGGIVYAYGTEDGQGIDVREHWSANGTQPGNFFGSQLTSAGDVNKDGFEDVLVTTPYYNGSGTNMGRASLYLGSARGLATTPSWTYTGEVAHDLFGFSAASAGDVNGDGFDDIVIGAYMHSTGLINNGKAYVFYGSASGPATTPSWTAVGTGDYDGFGCSVSGHLDINGDGLDDVVIGAPWNITNGNATGKIYVYLGTPKGLQTTPRTLPWGADQDEFGYVVASAGDTNGDGFDDVIVGSPYNYTGGTTSGVYFVFLGSSTGLTDKPAWSVSGITNMEVMGSLLPLATDVNLDGNSDIMIGSTLRSETASQAGVAYLYLGGYGGPNPSPIWRQYGARLDYFGRALGSLGDINGDHFGEVVVSASHAQDRGLEVGKVYLYSGSWSTLIKRNWMLSGESDMGRFGSALSSADVNGDGKKELLVAANYAPIGSNTRVGKVFEYGYSPYVDQGAFYSAPFANSARDGSKWLSLAWSPSSQPPGTAVRFQVGTSSDGHQWTYLGPDGTVNSYYTDPAGSQIPVSQLGKLWRYRVLLSSDLSATRTPRLDKVTVTYKDFDRPTVTVTSPNGGEDWMNASGHTITWTAAGDLGPTPVSIYYSITNGSTWTTIALGVANLGYYKWTVPHVDTPGALIKVVVEDLYGNLVQDTSDTSFAIDPPPVQEKVMELSSPSEGAVWGQGSNMISWRFLGIPGLLERPVNLSYTLDGGATWTILATDLLASGQYEWVAPHASSKECFVKAQASGPRGPVETVQSGKFTLDTVPPQIAHTPPVAAKVGTPLVLTISVTEELGPVDAVLYYRTDQGSPYLSKDMITTDGKNYTVQLDLQEPGNLTYKFKVTDGANTVEFGPQTVPIGKEGPTTTQSSGNAQGYAPQNIVLGFLVVVLVVSLAVNITFASKRPVVTKAVPERKIKRLKKRAKR